MIIDDAKAKQLMETLKMSVQVQSYFKGLMPLVLDLAKVVEETRTLFGSKEQLGADESRILQNSNTTLGQIAKFLEDNPFKA